MVAREASKKQAASPKDKSAKQSAKGEGSSPASPGLLHSGPMLGDLPLLASPKKDGPRSPQDSAIGSGDGGKKKKKKKPKPDPRFADAPAEFLCELSKKLMTEPVKSRYGHVFEKSAILSWISNQGHICPITGAPISESDFEFQQDLQMKIRKWILQKSEEPRPANTESKQTSVPTDNDDLYDF